MYHHPKWHGQLHCRGGAGWAAPPPTFARGGFQEPAFGQVTADLAADVCSAGARPSCGRPLAWLWPFEAVRQCRASAGSSSISRAWLLQRSRISEPQPLWNVSLLGTSALSEPQRPRKYRCAPQPVLHHSAVTRATVRGRSGPRRTRHAARRGASRTVQTCVVPTTRTKCVRTRDTADGRVATFTAGGDHGGS